jgi:hypothetical protein
MEQRKVIINQRICLYTHTLSQKQNQLRRCQKEREKASKTHLCFSPEVPFLSERLFCVALIDPT